MILYVNGDSHTAAAEAVNVHAFAEDDGRYFYMGRAPHPDNLAVSWGKLLSQALRCSFHCGAESASSNDRIMRTTREWLHTTPRLEDVFVVIQWSTWEREEWLIEGQYYQVNASGVDQVPANYQTQYREYIANVDWKQKTQHAHEEIWKFHQELTDQNIKHVFFNGNNSFKDIKDQKDWGTSYIEPYNPEKTFDAVIRSAGIDTVAPDSWHFGKDGHRFWNRFMLQYIIENKII